MFEAKVCKEISIFLIATMVIESGGAKKFSFLSAQVFPLILRRKICPFLYGGIHVFDTDHFAMAHGPLLGNQNRPFY